MEAFFESIDVVALVFFVIGMVLLLIEMFIPGFGIIGGLGLVCLLICIVIQAKTVTEALLMLLGIGALVVGLLLIAGRSLKKGRLYRSALVLKNTAGREEGYVAGSDYSRFSDSEGISLTPLRPAGIAELGGERAEVITDGEFIPAGTQVVVIRVTGRNIFVARQEAPASADTKIAQ